MFSKHRIELLDNLLKQKVQHQGCAQSSRSAHLSVPRSGHVAAVYTPSLKDYVEEGNFIRDIAELRNQGQFVLASDKLGLTRTLRDSFMLIAGYYADASLLSVARVLLLFGLNSRTDRGEAWYVFLQYTECTPALDGVGKALGCV